MISWSANRHSAISITIQAIRVDPEFAEAYSNLGNALKELGDLDAAVQAYDKAIRLKPRFCDPYNNLGSTYAQMGRSEDAIETYKMALMLNPALADAHSNLGNLYKAQGLSAIWRECCIYLHFFRRIASIDLGRRPHPFVALQGG